MKTPILKVICTTAIFTAVIATGLMIGSQRRPADSDKYSD